MTSNVIVDDVSKKFSRSLRGAMRSGFSDVGRLVLGRQRKVETRTSEFWALRNVSFELLAGEALGILGRNGSGKTTLLRILNGTFPPDSGSVALRGQVGALIAAGAGFSPLLTGRENVYISGSLLGLTPSEISRSFDEIVAFADLAEHIDVPVKNYSSGMTVRLGFAIAVLGRPDVLLVDEVLAVGDIAFQRKCFEYIGRLRDSGTSILLVSHAPPAIWAVCTKGLVLDSGVSSGVSDVETACKLYEDLNASNSSTSLEWDSEADSSSEVTSGERGDGSVAVEQIETLDIAGNPCQAVTYGESFRLRLTVWAREPLEECMIRVQVDSQTQKAIGILDNYEQENRSLSLPEGTSVWEITVTDPRLRPGSYSFSVSVIPRKMSLHLFVREDMTGLQVTHPPDQVMYADFRAALHLQAAYQQIFD